MNAVVPDKEPEEKPKHKAPNFWFLPLVGSILFVGLTIAYIYLIFWYFKFAGLVSQDGHYFRYAGLNLYISYGQGCATFLLGSLIIAGAFSLITTMVVLHGGELVLKRRKP
jgi:hypothetical protein